ncbi:MAG: hypothetical protein ACK4J0_03665 [Candidatus Anstonellaceae archaeon]
MAILTEPIFKGIKNNFLRAILEVLVSSIPGTLLLTFFILLIGVLNIYFNLSEANDVSIFFYFPVICILPVIIGILAPLVLEKVQAAKFFDMKLSVAVAFLSSLLGSLIPSIILLILGFGFENFKPFGVAIQNFLPTPIGLIVASFILVFSSVFLAVLGSILYVFIINRIEK